MGRGNNSIGFEERRNRSRYSLGSTLVIGNKRLLADMASNLNEVTNKRPVRSSLANCVNCATHNANLHIEMAKCKYLAKR